MAVINRERQLLFYNRAADALSRRVIGRGLELNHALEEFLLEDARPAFVDACQRAMGGESVELKVDEPGLDKAVKWREYRFRPVSAEDAEGVYISAVDVAAQRWADEQFSVIFGAAPIPMAVLDAQATIRQVNDALCDQLGYRRDAIISQPIWSMTLPDLRDEVAEQYRRFVAGDLGTRADSQFGHTRWYSRERRYINADGEEHWADVVRVAVRRLDGAVDYVLVMLLDTTGYKRSQQALEKERARTQAIFDTAVDGIVTVDDHGLIRQFNRASEEIFGYSHDEIIGECVTKLIPMPERADTNGHLTRRELLDLVEEASTGGEFEACRKDGSRFPIYLGIGEMHIDHEHKFAGIVRDLTHQKELERRVRRSERMEALGQLAGGIAHDFNNVLTIVNSYAHTGAVTLEQGKDPLFYFKKIRAAADRGARLTRQLLTFSPEQIGEPRVVDLNRIVREIEMLMRSVLEEDIELDVITCEDVPAIVADPGQIEQVLMNLVVNARDAMAQGGELCIQTQRAVVGEEHPAVHAAGNLEPGECASLQVSDSGIGMDKETQNRIFEPFFTTKSSGKGTGLGLATVYGIVQRYHGDLLVDSAPGEGTTFSIYFPASADEASEAEAGGDEHEREVRGEASETILIVEDEEDIRAPLRMVLEAEGYTVLEAASGEEALEIVDAHPHKIDLVLTDVVMPGLTGIELSNSLREQYPNIQAVLVSGYSGDVLERKDIDAQQVRVSKPYDLDDLLDMLRRMLDNA